MWFTTIKNYYLQGIYDDDHLEKFVLAKMITQEEMKEIISSKQQ